MSENTTPENSPENSSPENRSPENSTPDPSSPEPDHSGNRWEPTDASTEPGDEPGHEPAAATMPPSSHTSPFTRARVVVAGVAAAVLLVGGVGGFAVGRATAGDEDWDGPGNHQQVGFPPGGAGFPGDLDRDRDRDGDRPGFGEGDDDGDDGRDGSDT
ncbi:hypothetical protein [Nocardioides dilutus]